METKHAKTLRSIFTKPTLVNISSSDIELLVIALSGEAWEGEGSRVVFEINGKRHRPHPGKEAKRSQVEELRTLLESSIHYRQMLFIRHVFTHKEYDKWKP